MLMVIFGAGASYDSVPDAPAPHPSTLQPERDIQYRLPVAIHLFLRRPIFDAAIERYSQCVPIVQQLRTMQHGGGFERELELLRAEADVYPRRHVQLHAIRYYLHEIIWTCTQGLLSDYKSVTNYASLLDRIAHWLATREHEAVRFITFNYDTLLEKAFSDVTGRNLDTLASYVTSQDYRIYKPHGSISWVRDVANDGPTIRANPAQGLINLGDKLEPIEDAYHLNTEQPGRQVLSYPALALPVETKSKFEMKSSHLSLMKEDIAAVTKLLVVGWRATEAHFLELWAGRLPFAALKRVYVVAGSFEEAGNVKARLEQAKVGAPTMGFPPGADFMLSHQGFTQFMSGGGVDEFLRD